MCLRHSVLASGENDDLVLALRLSQLSSDETSRSTSSHGIGPGQRDHLSHLRMALLGCPDFQLILLKSERTSPVDKASFACMARIV